MSELSVREITPADVEHILDYWLGSSAEHLMGMGVDLMKMPGEGQFRQMLESQFELAYKEKQSFCLIWSIDDKPVGHNNINTITFGESAYMHLHLWKNDGRRKGLGSQFLKKSIPIFFEKYELNTLYCEPFSENPAPHKTIERLGFEFVKEHVTVPGSINFEQSVKLWKLERSELQKLIIE